jgi:IS5 family transposase
MVQNQRGASRCCVETYYYGAFADYLLPIPAHSIISRFRHQLVKFNLFALIFNEVKQQLAAKGTIVKTGEISIVDAV